MSYIQHKAEESLEDYLETILILSKRLSVVRSIDVATELNYSKPSVSVAMKNLKNREYITVSPDRRGAENRGKRLRAPHPVDGLAGSSGR